ncbi:DUF6913 domain-containing protein [Algibacter pacificus]|uniref:DUF6913 domain-containing protein n=1 Tax=Algibacter pacificus TaxID=2599389 RepID=UPI0011CC07B3|nr:hypothetical protein [Algibacter pacificus]
MILKGFKEKSNKKHLNKLLAERELKANNGNVERLGIVFYADGIIDLEWFKILANTLKVKPNELKIITFSRLEKELLNPENDCYNPKDFGWNGRIKNLDLQAFLDVEFDVLISYYDTDILELKLITAKSKAKFKIGILQNDERLNDLIIKTNLKAFDLFKTETFKYLKILNKIKNE